MLHSNSTILLFFALPFKAKWIVLIIMGFNLFSLISEGSFIYLAACLTSFLLSYLFCLVFWKTYSYFDFLKKIERTIINFFTKKDEKSNKSKIYDFTTGSPVIDDDQFMDEMLLKISLHGEDSLTKKERKRMDKISLKKK
jgi:hypothetical protein